MSGAVDGVYVPSRAADAPTGTLIVAPAIAEQPVERLLAVAVDVHLVALGLEVEAEPVGEVGLVFDDEDPAQLIILGSSSVKVAPLFSPTLSANTRPPCRFAIDRTM